MNPVNGLQMNETYSNLFDRFDDESEFESDSASWRIVALVTLAILSMAAVLICFAGKKDGTIAGKLHGPNASMVAVGAPVMMDEVRIGTVQKVGLEDGQAVGRLKLTTGIERQIPAGSKFVVRSLNSVLPGDVDVEVVKTRTTDLGPRDLSLGEIQASSEVFPNSISQKLYLVITIMVFAIAFVIGLALKIARIKWLRFGAILCLTALVIFLVHRRIIPIESIRVLFDAALNSIRGFVS